jgi:hypothetical protein
MSTSIDAGSTFELSENELTALRRAAAWYFKRHARIIAEEADDFSARAVVDRADFLELHAALRKLGVAVALPDELRSRSAA